MVLADGGDGLVQQLGVAVVCVLHVERNRASVVDSPEHREEFQVVHHAGAERYVDGLFPFFIPIEILAVHHAKPRFQQVELGGPGQAPPAPGAPSPPSANASGWWRWTAARSWSRGGGASAFGPEAVAMAVADGVPLLLSVEVDEAAGTLRVWENGQLNVDLTDVLWSGTAVGDLTLGEAVGGADAGLANRIAALALFDTVLPEDQRLAVEDRFSDQYAAGQRGTPVVRLASPGDNHIFPGPLANIPLRVEVPRSDAPIVRVEYLLGGGGEEVLTEVTVDAGIDPDDEEAMKVFEQVWYGVPGGWYELKARATDMAGQASESAVSLVQVRAPVGAGGGGSTGGGWGGGSGGGSGSTGGAGGTGEGGGNGADTEGEPNPDDIDGDGLSNEYELKNGSDPELKDSDDDGLDDNIDAVPYDNAFDKWERQAVPRYAVIETGEMTPDRINDHGFVLGYVGADAASTENKEWYLWYDGSWDDHRIDPGGPIQSIALTGSKEIPVVGSYKSGETDGKATYDAFAYYTGSGTTRTLAQPGNPCSGSVVGWSFAAGAVDGDGLILGSGGYTIELTDSEGNLMVSSVWGGVTWPGGWVETPECPEDGEGKEPENKDPNCWDAVMSAKQSLADKQENVEEVRRTLTSGADPLIVETVVETKLVNVAEAEDAVKDAEDALNDPDGDDPCGGTDAFELPQIVCETTIERTAVFRDKRRGMWYKEMDSVSGVVDAVNLVPTQPEIAQLHHVDWKVTDDGEGECPRKKGDKTFAGRGVWVTHNDKDGTQKDQVTYLYDGGSAYKAGNQIKAEDGHSHFDFVFEPDLRALVGPETANGYGQGAQGQWVNGELHPWQEMTGGYGVEYRKRNTSEMIIGKVSKDGGGQVGGILLPMELVPLDANGVPEKTYRGLQVSMPAPEIDLANVKVQSVSMVDGQLTANVLVAGTTRSDLCDTLPGDDGTIDSVQIWMNGDSEGTTETLPTIGLTDPKLSYSGDPTNPYPWVGTFNE